MTTALPSPDTVQSELDRINATRVEINFSGYGDEGGITSVFVGHDDSLSTEGDIEKLEGILSGWADNITNDHISGYYNDGGGSGDITLTKDDQGNWGGVMTYSYNEDEEFDVPTFQDGAAEASSITGSLDDGERAAIATLVEKGVKTIEINYSGYGDVGDIEGVSITGHDRDDIDLDESIREKVRDLARGLIENYHGGYEQDGGGSGYIKFKFDNQGLCSVSMSAWSRFTQSGEEETIVLSDMEMDGILASSFESEPVSTDRPE